MEQHPVPRNISSFQFHLIGDMTLRQFGYLAAGIILAYFTYKSAPLPSLFKYPLSGFFALVGFAFAFLPIQERPLDKWLVAFIKSITSPTQYLWAKNNEPFEIFNQATNYNYHATQTIHVATHHQANEKLKAYLASLPQQPHESLNAREKKYIDSTLSLFQTSATSFNPTLIPHVNPPVFTQIHVVPNVQTNTSVSKIPTLSASSKTDSVAPIAPILNPTPVPVVKTQSEKQIPKIETNLTGVQKIPTQTPQVQTPPVQTVSAPAPLTSDIDHSQLTKQLEELAKQKKLLEEELKHLKEDMTRGQKSNIIKPVNSKEEPPAPTIKTITPKDAINEIGLPNNQYPNIITGVLKDPQRKILPNVILTIKDKNSSPLRALKTNKLGQFATATPLPNGTYLIEAEDPMKRYNFDIAQIVLSGKVYPPIEIIAKGEKEIMREKLSRELFGGVTI